MNSSRAKGFSLVEVMMVVVVITILTLLAMPSFSAWAQNERTRSAAELLQNGFRFAQAEAIRRNRFTTITVVPTGSWAINYIQTAADTGSNAIQSSPGGNLTGATINFGSSLGGGTTALEFDTLGRVYNFTSGATAALGGAATFSVTNSVSVQNQTSYRVIVSPSGKVTMCDPNLTFDPINQPTGCNQPTGS